MNFTLKEIAERYKVPLSTLKHWNGTKSRILNRLAMLDLFIQETSLAKKDLEATKQLLNKKEDYSLKSKALSVQKKYEEYFRRAKNFETAAELYALNLSVQELKALYKLKKGE